MVGGAWLFVFVLILLKISFVIFFIQKPCVSLYTEHMEQQQKKLTWIENVINRTVEWKLSMDGLHYSVVGERTNHQDLILNPKFRKVVLFEGTRKGVYKPFEDVLRDIADTWAAEVLLGHGEAYRGENKVSGDKCETVLTYQKTGDKSEYIYFEQQE